MSARAAVLAAAVTAVLAGGGPAGADPASDGGTDAQFAAAIAAVRDGTSCGPLRRDPTVERVATLSNQSTRDYLEHTARHVPVDDPLAVLRELGGDAGTAIQLQGFGPDTATAIKGALLQGNTSIGVCSFDRIGTSVLRTADGERVLVVAVLAGR